MAPAASQPVWRAGKKNVAGCQLEKGECCRTRFCFHFPESNCDDENSGRSVPGVAVQKRQAHGSQQL